MLQRRRHRGSASDSPSSSSSLHAAASRSSSSRNSITKVTARFQSLTHTQLYLLAYNLVSFLSWLFIAALISVHLLSKDYSDAYHLYERIATPLYFIQSLALLESVHALTGLVRASFFSAFLQQFGRSFLLWGVLYPVVDSRHSIGFTILAVAWTSIEIIRYPFYCAYQLLGESVPDWLVWLRYSAWLVLYPFGIVGEMLCLVSALPSLRQHNIWTLEMPNALNFSFDWLYYVLFAALLYLPGTPYLLGHLQRQRTAVFATRGWLGDKQAKHR